MGLSSKQVGELVLMLMEHDYSVVLDAMELQAINDCDAELDEVRNHGGGLDHKRNAEMYYQIGFTIKTMKEQVKAIEERYLAIRGGVASVGGK